MTVSSGDDGGDDGEDDDDGDGDDVQLDDAAEEDEEVNELLAALGHKVHSSDMGDLAQKLEQLEMAMGMGGVG
ncbi:hypothetical protein QYE76_000507 [Lolium multiflorum]|uniref:Transcriptional factor DELLA N-terminal domain-containing protein n=1 Tax=Lolium multiflorum TaxID=4521 RepID=A0AAD8VWF7_LOLMU|nr:hypothetical protein QYE76_000507 [Lolium multiflorum]